MKKTFAFAAIATLMAAPAAFAGDETLLADIDANADGFVTIEELRAGDMDVTAESFADWDVNGDAKLSDAEFTAWKKAVSADWGKPVVKATVDATAEATDDTMQSPE